MKELSNMILVAGAGRNVGKTVFICELIKHFSSAHELTGIKISPHIHHQSLENIMIRQSNHFIICKEVNAESGKDSSRMLRAGAHKVYYIEAADKYLPDALNAIMPEIDSCPVICESAGLRKFVIPGIFIFIENILHSGYNKNSWQKEKADFIVHAVENSFNFNCRDIDFDRKRWKRTKTG